MTSRLEHLILNATINNSQSYYLSEGKNFMAIHNSKYYDDQLYPILLKIFRSGNFGTNSEFLRISQEDLFEDDDKTIIRLKFATKDNRKELQLTSESIYKGIPTKVVSSGFIVNELYEIENIFLSKEQVLGEYKDKLEELLENISENVNLSNANIPPTMYGIETSNYNKIILTNEEGRNHEIACYRDHIMNPYVEKFNKTEVFIIARGLLGEKFDFYIGEPEMTGKPIKFSGVLFVQGNIIISSNFEFHGIMIVKDGEIIINTEAKPKIYGKIIFCDDFDCDYMNEKANLVYSQDTSMKYGSYLPNFFEPKINLIKSANK